MKLVLGVIDIPYANYGKRRGGKAKAGHATTGDVAGFLENKYHIMETFFDRHGAEVASDLEDGIKGALESYLQGAPVNIDPFGSGTAKVEDRFKTFLSSGEIEKLGISGVPTKAALNGVNRRFNRPYAKRAKRVSFIDTGQFQAAFKAWIE